jgi:hypothetical protein
MAELKIENTMDSNAIGAVAQCPRSALVEVAANAMQTNVRDAHVIRINEGPWLDFEATHKLGKSLGFGGYLNLLEWLVEKYGAPFKGVVHWPNTKLVRRA